MIHIFHVFRIVQSAGAFCQGNVFHLVLPQPADNALDDKRVGGYRIVGAFGHNKIRLYHHLQIGAHILCDREGVHGFADCRVNKFLLVGGNQMHGLYHKGSPFY